MVFAWKYLTESNDQVGVKTATGRWCGGRAPRSSASLSHPGEPASRLIWIYAVGMGAFQGMTAILALFLVRPVRDRREEHRLGVRVHRRVVGGARALLLGPAVDRYGEPKLSRYGTALLALGLRRCRSRTTTSRWRIAIALIPLGTAFTFPCVTGMLSQVIPNHERGLYMGVQQTFGGLARVVGPIWAGFAFDYLGKGVPFYTGAALALFTLTLGAGIEQHLPGAKPNPAAG
jgi:MFS family permease